ncbi:hypothetical protein LTR08_008167 [Meristemomyces frigidus]|nr:hypothetical protein LTR08_008167 [Meristemomyces frigidus]
MSTFSEANRKAFNELSETYNTKPWQQKLSSQVSEALQKREDWIGVQWATPGDGRDVRLLDYACGTGSITKALGPYVTTIQGIDISENMVEQYNKAALSSGMKPENANAVVGDLFAEKVPEHLAGERFQGFDIAVIGLGFHHFEDPTLSVKRLVERLKPEGVLVIVDFLPFDHDHQQATDADAHGMAHTIKHNGFEAGEMEKLFTKAGLEDFGWSVLAEPATLEFERGTVDRTLFVARGRRPATTWNKMMTWASGMQDQLGGQLDPRADGQHVPPGGHFGLRADGT